MATKRLFVLTVLLCLVSALASANAIEIFPLDQVVPGLQGVGKTVVMGTEVEDFDVTVIGIMQQVEPTPSFIMVRVSGDAIDRSGGIASGMSGSPVYVDGKLLGAISHGYENTNHRVGLVTPAAQMLDLLADVKANNANSKLPKGFTKLATPLLVNGMSSRSLRILEEAFAPYQIQIIPGVTGQNNSMVTNELVPGSAIGVQLLRGDFQAVAYGTLTHIDEQNNFVGFGHSFLHSGNVNYFVAPAYVHYTMPHSEFPFKIASSGESVGTVYTDRTAGIGGVIGPLPPYIPMDISITDLQRDIEHNYHVDITKAPALVSDLAISSVYQAIDATLDRIGQGTAYTRFEFYAKGLKNPVVKENLFYSSSDIAVWALSDLMEGIDLIVGNTLQEVELESITTYVEIDETRQTAEIVKAVPQEFKVLAGDSIDIEVTIRPYRQPVEKRILRITIPVETMPSLMTVTVRGGGSGYYMIKPTVHTTWETIQKEDDPQLWNEPTNAENLDMLLHQYMDRERNNELVAEFYPYIDYYGLANDVEQLFIPVPKDDDKVPVSDIVMLENDIITTQWDEQSDDSVRVRLTTQYVLEGVATFEIEVIEPES